MGAEPGTAPSGAAPTRAPPLGREAPRAADPGPSPRAAEPRPRRARAPPRGNTPARRARRAAASTALGRGTSPDAQRPNRPELQAAIPFFLRDNASATAYSVGCYDNTHPTNANYKLVLRNSKFQRTLRSSAEGAAQPQERSILAVRPARASTRCGRSGGNARTLRAVPPTSPRWSQC